MSNADRLASQCLCALFAACLALASTPASGEVKMVQRPDGTLVMVNTPSLRGDRTLSYRLREAPEGTIRAAIDTHAARNSLSPKLVQAVIQVESAYRVRAVSNKGARGLMQLMPATARELGVRDVFDADQNIDGGARYLRQMLNRFGRLELALAAYNAGPGAVERHRGVPPYRETRDYVRKVLRLYHGQEPTLRTVAGQLPAVSSSTPARSFAPDGSAATGSGFSGSRTRQTRPVVVREVAGRRIITNSAIAAAAVPAG